MVKSSSTFPLDYFFLFYFVYFIVYLLYYIIYYFVFFMLYFPYYYYYYLLTSLGEEPFRLISLLFFLLHVCFTLYLQLDFSLQPQSI